MPGRVVVGMYSFHTPDPRRLAAFWAELMSLPVAEASTDELVMLDLDHEVGPVTWLFQKAAGDTPPGGRVALDVHNDSDEEWFDAADRAEALGATRHGDHEQDGARWIELSDPDGNPFRVFAPRPT